MEKKLNRNDISKNIIHKYSILLPDGKEIEINLENQDECIEIIKKLGDKNLLAYVKAEELKGGVGVEPPANYEMKRLELADDEPSSDSGNHRMYPNGHLMFDLIKEWQSKIAKEEMEAMEINSPLFFDKNDSQINQQAGSFHERHYMVKVPDNKDKEFILRFAGDFGLFKMVKDANFSYKQLPLRFFERAVNFRYEQSGELCGLKRDRMFNMADLHCFCEDEEQGWDEFSLIFAKYEELYKKFEFDYCLVVRVVESFYEKYKDRFLKLASLGNKPVFVDKIDEMKHYWAVKYEWQSIDSVGSNQQLSTVQFDIKEGKVYGINYVDKNGEKKDCVIIHSAVGGIERCMYALIEDALKKNKPVFPLWLSPSQLRIIPVSNDAHLDFCKELKFDKIRVDIDDRNEKLGRKLVRARQEWVPYVIVVGDQEKQNQIFKVNDRYQDQVHEFNKEQLQEFLDNQLENMPRKSLAMNKLLSKRPCFYGGL